MTTDKIKYLTKHKKSSYWKQIQEKYSLQLFHDASERVPAYKNFLNSNKIDHKKIVSFSDFQKVPFVTKKNYLSKNTLADLAWDGKLMQPLVYTATSGTSGDPTFFMRTNTLDWQYSLFIEQFLESSQINLKKPILVIDCFGMGLWIAGLITYKAFEITAIRKRYPISIITPGINKREIFNILRLLAPQYEQIIFTGYAPFLKDIFDDTIKEKIQLKKYIIKILFAAEAISEPFRDYVAKQCGIKDVYRDIINIYGSADIGAMAVETLLGTLIKRLALKNNQLSAEFFRSENKTGTLAQYNPLFINFEAVNGEIVLTGDSALPLVRYAIGDKGGVYDYNAAADIFKKHELSLPKEIFRRKINDSTNELPFVYIYERVDLSTTFYGMWIYPAWLKNSLLVYPVSKYLTGKFTLMTKFDSFQNQYLEISLELKKDKKISPTIKKLILEKIVSSLRISSSEYRELSDKLGNKVWPQLIYWPYESEVHFKPGVKQKWVKKI
jgi:phenylacetate-CoA ligase